MIAMKTHQGRPTNAMKYVASILLAIAFIMPQVHGSTPAPRSGLSAANVNEFFRNTVVEQNGEAVVQMESTQGSGVGNNDAVSSWVVQVALPGNMVAPTADVFASFSATAGKVVNGYSLVFTPSLVRWTINSNMTAVARVEMRVSKTSGRKAQTEATTPEQVGGMTVAFSSVDTKFQRTLNTVTSILRNAPAPPATPAPKDSSKESKEDRDRRIAIGVGVGIAAALVLLGFIIALIIFCIARRNRRQVQFGRPMRPAVVGGARPQPQVMIVGNKISNVADPLECFTPGNPWVSAPLMAQYAAPPMSTAPIVVPPAPPAPPPLMMQSQPIMHPHPTPMPQMAMDPTFGQQMRAHTPVHMVAGGPFSNPMANMFTGSRPQTPTQNVYGVPTPTQMVNVIPVQPQQAGQYAMPMMNMQGLPRNGSFNSLPRNDSFGQFSRNDSFGQLPVGMGGFGQLPRNGSFGQIPMAVPAHAAPFASPMTPTKGYPGAQQWL